MRLVDVAPRIGRARDQILAERQAAQIRHHLFIHNRLRLERLIAHRELQLQRAQAGVVRGRRRSSYIAERRAKLDAAIAERMDLEEKWQEPPARKAV